MARFKAMIAYWNDGTKQVLRDHDIFTACRAIGKSPTHDMNFYSDASSDDWVFIDNKWVRQPDPEFRKQFDLEVTAAPVDVDAP